MKDQLHSWQDFAYLSQILQVYWLQRDSLFCEEVLKRMTEREDLYASK